MSSSLGRKVANKRINSEKEGIKFNLTLEEVAILLEEAGITPKQWCVSGYHLARFNDQGNYEVGNCRFIPAEDNYAERKTSELSRVASVRNMTVFNESMSSEERSTRARELGIIHCNVPGGWNKLTDETLVEMFERVKHLPLSSYGVRKEIGRILGCSNVHAGRLRKRWIKLGLM